MYLSDTYEFEIEFLHKSSDLVPVLRGDVLTHLPDHWVFLYRTYRF